MLLFRTTDVVIGFVSTSYLILENGGQQEVCAEVKMGTLRAEVEVQFSTSDGDATGNNQCRYRLIVTDLILLLPTIVQQQHQMTTLQQLRP